MTLGVKQMQSEHELIHANESCDLVQKCHIPHFHTLHVLCPWLGQQRGQRGPTKMGTDGTLTKDLAQQAISMKASPKPRPDVVYNYLVGDSPAGV